MYKIPCKPEGGLMTERWVLGTWLGKRALSDEHVVAVDSGEVCVSSAVRLLPDSESWSLDRINNIIGTLWNPRGADQAERREVEVEVIPAGLPLDPGHPVQPRLQQPEGVPREIYIRREHLSKYGYTEGYMKCRSIRESFQITRLHSSSCRERICEHMKSEGNVADLEEADERKMRYYAREVEQADRESKKARFVAPENTQEELPPNSGGPSSSSTLWKPLGKRSGEEELDGTRPQKIMKEVQREPSRSQKRERDGDEAEDERPDRYQAVQEDNKDIVMEEVKSFNKVAFEINQEVRDERMNRLLINNPNTDECWNINAKKSMAEAVQYVDKWKPHILHLEPNSWSHMQAAIRLAQVQRQYDRDFVIVELVVSSSWNVPAARAMVRDKSTKQVVFNSCFGTGPRYRALTNSCVLRDRLHRSIRRRMTMLLQDDVRKVIGEVNDIRKKVRAEQHSASDVMNMVDNLHDAEETEGVYIDDVNGGELSKEKVEQV